MNTVNLISIITPVKNGARYLEQCIQSVLGQTYPHIEHIFVDGVSTDGTLEILRKFHGRFPDRIKFISEPDQGSGECWNGAINAWNKGWKIARGEVLGWLGADDYYEPDTAMIINNFFNNNPNACFVFGRCNTIDETGKRIYAYPQQRYSLDSLINDGNIIPAPSAFYRKKVIRKIGDLDVGMNAADYDYWIRVGKQFEIYQMDRVLSHFRVHKGSTSGSTNADYMFRRQDFRISRRHGGRLCSRITLRYLLISVFGPKYKSMWGMVGAIKRRMTS